MKKNLLEEKEKVEMMLILLMIEYSLFKRLNLPFIRGPTKVKERQIKEDIEGSIT